MSATPGYVDCPDCKGGGRLPETPERDSSLWFCKRCKSTGQIVPTRVYVAAPFSEYKLVREVQAELRRRGATISTDWTEGIEFLPPGVTDGDISEEVALKAALDDFEGVISADACIFLTVADKSKGCGQWCELGAAVICRCLVSASRGDWPAARDAMVNKYGPMRIAVTGPMRDRTIFSRFGKRFVEWQDALPYVLGEAP